MKALSRLAALLTSVYMLSGIHFANADDLDSFVKNRQQVLNQFEDARQPASPALIQLWKLNRKFLHQFFNIIKKDLIGYIV